MKKLFYLLATGALMLASCESQPSYKITGNAPLLLDSTIVYLQRAQGRSLVKLDSTMIINGQFSFSGRQDTAIHRYVSAVSEGIRYRTDFFLENGTIALTLDKECCVTGTPSNDAYQAFKQEYNILKKEQKELYNTRVETDEEKKDLMRKINATHVNLAETVKKHVNLNATTGVGAYLFAEYIDFLTEEQQKEILAKMPEVFKNDRKISKIIKHIEILDKTAVGQKFTDFAMPDPQGKMVKLSDIVAKNKYTLVDFWASWCGPCRAEMPHVIEAYNKYNKKGFGIVGVSLDSEAGNWTNAIKEWKMPWIHISDLKSFECEGAALYGINSIPSTILIAQDGTIVARTLRGNALEKKLEELFK